MADVPDYWIRQRNGMSVGAYVPRSGIAAALAEARPYNPHGDYLAPTGLVWIEPDPRGPGGFSYRTLTPVWKPQP